MLYNSYGKQKLKFSWISHFWTKKCQKKYYTYHGHSEMSLYPKILVGTYSNSVQKIMLVSSRGAILHMSALLLADHFGKRTPTSPPPPPPPPRPTLIESLGTRLDDSPVTVTPKGRAKSQNIVFIVFKFFPVGAWVKLSTGDY